MLRHDHKSTFQRISPATGRITTNVSWKRRKYSGSSQGTLIEYSCLIVVTNENTSCGKHDEEWIQVERVSCLQPIHSQRGSSIWKNFNGWHRCTIRTLFSANNNDRSIGHDASCW